MKITQIEKQKKNIKRFNVYIDGKFAFGADEDLVVNHRLISGKIISEDDLEKLLFEAEVGKLLERLYSLFARRQRSEQEVRIYLQQLSYKRNIKGKDTISDIVVELIIDRLKKKNLINDQEFARVWIDSRRKSKQKGKIALKSELIQKGIEKDLIDEVLGQQLDNEEELLARQALEKKIKKWQNLSPLEFKKKAYEFLARRGFNYSTISSVVANYMKKG